MRQVGGICAAAARQLPACCGRRLCTIAARLRPCLPGGGSHTPTQCVHAPAGRRRQLLAAPLGTSNHAAAQQQGRAATQFRSSPAPPSRLPAGLQRLHQPHRAAGVGCGAAAGGARTRVRAHRRNTQGAALLLPVLLLPFRSWRCCWWWSCCWRCCSGAAPAAAAAAAVFCACLCRCCCCVLRPGAAWHVPGRLLPHAARCGDGLPRCPPGAPPRCRTASPSPLGVPSYRLDAYPTPLPGARAPARAALQQLTPPITSLADFEEFSHEHELDGMRHLSLSVLNHFSFEREALK